MICQRCSNQAKWRYTSKRNGNTIVVCSSCRLSWCKYESLEDEETPTIPAVKQCTVYGCINVAQWALGNHPDFAHCTPCKEANVEMGSDFDYTPLITIAELSDPKRSQKGDLTDSLIDFGCLKEVRV